MKNYVVFPGRNSEVNGFYLLLENDRCIHSHPSRDRYGRMIYILDDSSLDLLVKNDIFFNVISNLTYR